jgi:hypothetical protein
MGKGARRAVLFGWVIVAFAGVEFAGAIAHAQAAAGATVADSKTVLQNARAAYYNLHSRGMASFQCDVVPDWHLALADMTKTNPEAARNLMQLLEQLHFTVSVAPDDAVTVAHKGLENVQNEDVLNGLKQIYGGMEQMVTGTFQTWNLFMLKTPFPDAGGDFELVDLGRRYQLKFKDEGADVTTTMGHDFAIDKMEVTNPGSESSIGPALTKTPQGFLLAGFDTTFKAEDMPEATRLQVGLEYKKVQGLEMLSRMTLKGASGSKPFTVEMGFSNCQAAMK